jgi:hypothetical protein
MSKPTLADSLNAAFAEVDSEESAAAACPPTRPETTPDTAEPPIIVPVPVPVGIPQDGVEVPAVVADGTAEIAPEDAPDLSEANLKLLDDVTTEVLCGHRADRQEAQDVITMLRAQVDMHHNVNKQAPNVYVENLVKAIEVKAGISHNAIKVLEARAKMLAALRNKGTVINNNNNNAANAANSVNAELTQLLADDPG